jgi:signal transduction histidine kinase
MFVLGPALVGLVAGLAWVLVGRALRPVHAVTSRVAAIGSRSLHERVPVPPGGDEVAELATTMNGMLQRLETASTTNRRLVSDASHELRTPVTVIRTELEVARRSAHPDWDAVSDVALGELDRLQVLVDDLLLLARSDEQRLAVAPVCRSSTLPTTWPPAGGRFPWMSTCRASGTATAALVTIRPRPSRPMLRR